MTLRDSLVRFASSGLPPYRPGVRNEFTGFCESLKALWTTQKDGYSAVTMATPVIWFTDHITELFFVEPTLDLKKSSPHSRRHSATTCCSFVPNRGHARSDLAGLTGTFCWLSATTLPARARERI